MSKDDRIITRLKGLFDKLNTNSKNEGKTLSEIITYIEGIVDSEKDPIVRGNMQNQVLALYLYRLQLKTNNDTRKNLGNIDVKFNTILDRLQRLETEVKEAREYQKKTGQE